MQKRSINKIIVVGRVGQDPEVRYSKNGNPIANLSVATTHSRKSGDGYEDETEWHKIVCFGSTAEFAKEYVSQGDLVSVVGRITTNSWQNKNGDKRSQKQIVASEFNKLTPKGMSQRSGKKSNNNGDEEDAEDIPF